MRLTRLVTRTDRPQAPCHELFHPNHSLDSRHVRRARVAWSSSCQDPPTHMQVATTATAHGGIPVQHHIMAIVEAREASQRAEAWLLLTLASNSVKTVVPFYTLVRNADFSSLTRRYIY